MNIWKKFTTCSLAGLLFLGTAPSLAFADAVAGDTVVTFGANLTTQQRDTLLKEMNVGNNVQTITVTNEEEHKYLGKYMSKATIGTRAISSARITIAESGKGIGVKTNNITAITEAMYANAAITAGIKDADIFVDAPFKVSGTAGLTGIIKAFEAVTGKKLDENQKLVANEEMVRTSEIGNLIKDPDKAAQFMNRVKEEVAKKNPQSTEDYKNIIINVSNEFNINLNPQTIEKLVDFTKNFSSLNIDWNSIQNQLSNLRGTISDVLNDPQTQDILHKVSGWLATVFTAIGDFFKSFSK